MIETMETENNCGVKRKWDGTSFQLSPLWPTLTCFQGSTLFLFLLFASQPSILPVDVAGLGNEKVILHVRRRAPPLSLSACKRGQKRKRKKSYCESLQWHRVPDWTTGQGKLASTSERDLPHLAVCAVWLASAVCSSVHLTLNTTAASFSHRGQKLSPRCFPHLLMDMINKCSGFHRQLDGPRERSKVCFRGELQRQWTSSPWLFHDVMWRDWAQPRRSAFIPEKSWTQTREGRHANLNMAKSLDLSGACASTPPAHLRLSLTQPLLIVKHVTWSTGSYWLFSASQSLSATVCFILVSGSLKMLPEKIHKVCVLPPRLCTRVHSTTDTSTSALTYIVPMAVYSEQLRCDVEPAPRLEWADLDSHSAHQAFLKRSPVQARFPSPPNMKVAARVT